jgi:predicted  nucleic acid-binding Zn-ribbon protein
LRETEKSFDDNIQISNQILNLREENEISKELNDLEKQKDDINTTIMMLKKKILNQKNIGTNLARNIDTEHSKGNQLKNKLKEKYQLTQKLNDLKSKLEIREQGLNKISTQLEDLKVKKHNLNDDYLSNLDDLDKEFNFLRDQFAKCNQSYTLLNNLKEKIKGLDSNSINSSLNDVKTQVSAIQVQIDSISSEIEKEGNNISSLSAESSKLIHEISTLAIY